jgi:threonine/homoserine/homoserine lactone efflux protein
MDLESVFYILGIIYIAISLIFVIVIIILLLKAAQRLRKLRQETKIMQSVIGRLVVWRIIRRIFG